MVLQAEMLNPDVPGCPSNNPDDDNDVHAAYLWDLEAFFRLRQLLSTGKALIVADDATRARCLALEARCLYTDATAGEGWGEGLVAGTHRDDRDVPRILNIPGRPVEWPGLRDENEGVDAFGAALLVGATPVRPAGVQPAPPTPAPPAGGEGGDGGLGGGGGGGEAELDALMDIIDSTESKPRSKKRKKKKS